MQGFDLNEYGKNNLAAKAQTYAITWELSNVVPLARTTMGLLQRVTCADGTFAVLKTLSEIGLREEGTAPLVLKAFAGSGAVRVLRSDNGAHLLEYCSGPRLLDLESGYDDDVAIPILADVVSRLRLQERERPIGVPTLAERCKALSRTLQSSTGTTAILFQKARQIADQLLADEVPTLLHGDIHHENVLRCDRPDGPSWLAIDPQGVWGDPAYEVANLFGNPLDHPEITLRQDRPKRLASILADALELPAPRILEWAFVHSCISAAWAIEDGLDPSYRLRLAELIGFTLR